MSPSSVKFVKNRSKALGLSFSTSTLDINPTQLSHLNKPIMTKTLLCRIINSTRNIYLTKFSKLKNSRLTQKFFKLNQKLYQKNIPEKRKRATKENSAANIVVITLHKSGSLMLTFCAIITVQIQKRIIFTPSFVTVKLTDSNIKRSSHISQSRRVNILMII